MRLGRSALSAAGVFVLCSLLGAGCHRVVTPEKPESFSGMRFSLLEGTALVVAGSVEGSPARVVLETAQPFTSVTAGCWREGDVPRSPGFVKVPKPEGGWRELPEIELRAARIGEGRLGARTVAVEKGGGCTLKLGLDVLSEYALHVDPFRRIVRFSPTGSTVAESAKAAPDSTATQRSTTQAETIALTREPTRDFLLVTARLRQGEATVTGPFVLSTGSQSSRLSTAVGLGNGMRAGARGFEDRSPPEALLRAPFRLDAVELSPSSSAELVAMDGVDAWSDELAVGVLGADVWGRFVTTFDVGAGVMTLWRPQVQDPEVQLQDSRLAAAMWTDVPGGVQLILRVDGTAASGPAAEGTCVFGVNIPDGTSGRTVNLPVPWKGLTHKFPACSAALENARSVELDRMEHGEHPVCAGACVFASVPERAAVSCVCEPEAFLSLEEETRLLREWEQQPGGDGGVPIVPGWADELPEPVDP